MFRYRYRRILFFFARILFSLTVWELIFPRLGLRKWVKSTRPERLRKIGVQFRALAIGMGGLLIKVGQFFSSRVDVLPREITSELSGLQDEVPPEDIKDIYRVAEAEFGKPLAEMFAEFEQRPMAAASLGQVHRARLCAGEPGAPGELCLPVVVKVQRPNIDKIVDVDLSALRTVGGWVHRYPPIRKRADVPALMDEFARIINEEIDYLAEGRNAETFAENFKEQTEVRVPGVVWSHTRRRVLTLEDVQAIKITDYEAISAAGIDLGNVARRLLNTYLKQIFEDGFFHADPHPGNLFVSPVRPSEEAGNGQLKDGWQLTFVDFGMVGRMSPNLRAGMREMIIGVGLRDPSRVVKSYQLLGVLLPGADLSLLEQAEAAAFDRFWGKNMNELQQVSFKEIQEFARQFRQLIYDLPFQIPQDLVLLGRTVGILSGMCTGLDPSFHVWEGIVPFAQKLIAEDAANGRSSWMDILGGVAQRLVQLPGRTESLFQKLERGELAVRDPQLTRQMRRVERSVRQVTATILFAALLLSGVQVYLAQLFPLAQVLLGGAALALAWLLLSLWPGDNP